MKNGLKHTFKKIEFKEREAFKDSRNKEEKERSQVFLQPPESSKW